MSLQALKVLKTAEFMPYVVFIAAPDFDTLKAMHKAVVDAGLTTKQLTVGSQLPMHNNGMKETHKVICLH